MDSASILRVIHQDVSKVCVHATSLCAKIPIDAIALVTEMRLILVFLLFLAAGWAGAQITSSGNYAVPPESGVWWNPNQPGVGYSVDVDRRGNAFIAWHTYRADGSSTFYTLGGKISRSYAASPDGKCDDRAWTLYCQGARLNWAGAGVTATLKSPIYAVESGGCPVCVPRFPVVTESALGPAEVRFFGSRNAEIRIQGAVLPIRMQDIATPFSELTDVKWVAINRFASQGVSQQIAVGSFVPTNIGINDLIYNNVPVPPSSAVMYKYQLSAGAVQLPFSFGFPAEGVLYVASNESTNRLQVYLVKETFNAILGPNRSVVSYGELFRYRDRMIAWISLGDIYFEEQASY
jgi:hypothetical protein